MHIGGKKIAVTSQLIKNDMLHVEIILLKDLQVTFSMNSHQLQFVINSEQNCDITKKLRIYQ